MANDNSSGGTVDTTSQDKPFRFWVNDGQNTGEDQPALTGSQASPPNYTLGQINFKGDLENFARLWMYIGGLQQAIHDGNIKIGFKNKRGRFLSFLTFYLLSGLLYVVSDDGAKHSY